MLSVIDQIWANGGRLADLVDREDVSAKTIFYQFICMNTEIPLNLSISLKETGFSSN